MNSYLNQVFTNFKATNFGALGCSFFVCNDKAYTYLTDGDEENNLEIRSTQS